MACHSPLAGKRVCRPFPLSFQRAGCPVWALPFDPREYPWDSWKACALHDRAFRFFQTKADGRRRECLTESSHQNCLELGPSVADAPPIGVDAVRRDGAAWVRYCHGGDADPLPGKNFPVHGAQRNEVPSARVHAERRDPGAPGARAHAVCVRGVLAAHVPDACDARGLPTAVLDAAVLPQV